MANWEVLKFASAGELAAAAAKRLVERLRSIDHNRPFTVALSGGRIAKTFSVSLAQQLSNSPTLLRNVHFFWADERCVGPDDEESNYKLAEDNLFKPLGVSGDQIHRIRGEVEPQAAASQAETELRSVASVGQDSQAILDLVLLGMGEDGHTASLFPEEGTKLVDDPRVFRAVVATKPPPERVTMGYGTLAAAREVLVLVSGSGKEAALKRSLTIPPETPLGRVLAMRELSLVLTDI
jgi:6-phosphogluconolactonase